MTRTGRCPYCKRSGIRLRKDGTLFKHLAELATPTRGASVCLAPPHTYPVA